MKKLNKEQKLFLEYLATYHKGVGWPITIKRYLKYGEYSTPGRIDVIISTFKALRDESHCIEIYGKPTKYLKG